MKIVFLSDLHIESLPRNEESHLFHLFHKIKRIKPDYIIFGGDIIDWHSCWPEFLSTYKRTFPDIKTGIILGNHDFWSFKTDPLQTREDVYTYVFEVCKRFDVNFLEEQPIIHENKLLCGTSAWYDYSVKPESINKEFLIVNRGKYNNDGNYIVSPISDEEYSEQCNKRLFSAIKKNQKSVDHIFVFTHIPVFQECIVQAPVGYRQNEWEMSNCYFYNLTLGQKLSKNKKIRLVTSGHIHRYMHGMLECGIEYVTGGSDYFKPEILLINVNDKDEISIERKS